MTRGTGWGELSVPSGGIEGLRGKISSTRETRETKESSSSCLRNQLFRSKSPGAKIMLCSFVVTDNRQIGLHMGPNNLCYVARHFFYFFPMSPCHIL